MRPLSTFYNTIKPTPESPHKRGLFASAPGKGFGVCKPGAESSKLLNAKLYHVFMRKYGNIMTMTELAC